MGLNTWFLAVVDFRLDVEDVEDVDLVLWSLVAPVLVFSIVADFSWGGGMILFSQRLHRY